MSIPAEWRGGWCKRCGRRMATKEAWLTNFDNGPIPDELCIGHIEKCTSQPDPRDARIAQLEAALREARGYVLGYDHCNAAGESHRQSLIARITTLLGGPPK